MIRSKLPSALIYPLTFALLIPGDISAQIQESNEPQMPAKKAFESPEPPKTTNRKPETAALQELSTSNAQQTTQVETEVNVTKENYKSTEYKLSGDSQPNGQNSLIVPATNGEKKEKVKASEDWNWTLLLASAAFILSLYNAIKAYLDRKEDRSRSIKDEFWFRTVLMPSAFEPLKKFIIDNRQCYDSIESITDSQLASQIQDLEDLSINFEVLGLIDFEVDVVEDIKSEFEKLIATISIAARPNEVYGEVETYRMDSNPYMDCFNAVVALLIKSHNELKY